MSARRVVVLAMVALFTFAVTAFSPNVVFADGGGTSSGPGQDPPGTLSDGSAAADGSGTVATELETLSTQLAYLVIVA
jgi:hypothetical protein